MARPTRPHRQRRYSARGVAQLPQRAGIAKVRHGKARRITRERSAVCAHTGGSMGKKASKPASKKPAPKPVAKTKGK